MPLDLAADAEQDVDQIPIELLYTKFESLGNNCEFGIVQRTVGFDPPGLFRNVGFHAVEQMISAISLNFYGMFEEGNFDFSIPDGWEDWRLDCKIYGFGFHTGMPLTLTRDSPEWSKRVASTMVVFRYLKEKIQEDLALGEKMFVYRSFEKVSSHTVRRLLGAIQLRSRAALLYVRADPSKPTGSLTFRGGGLVEATLTSLSNENPPRIEHKTWEVMVRKILASQAEVWKETDSMSKSRKLSLSVPEPPPVTALPPLIHNFGYQEVEPEHAFTFDLEGLPEQAMVTAYAWIYLPAQFEASRIDFVMLGYRSEKAEVPDASRRESWQRISVTAQIPPGQGRAVPALRLVDAGSGHFFSAGWGFHVGGTSAS